jgi:hypothetical protein
VHEPPRAPRPRPRPRRRAGCGPRPRPPSPRWALRAQRRARLPRRRTSHFIQLGQSTAARVDYRATTARRQPLLLRARLAVEIDVRRRHLITLLYQPLEIETRETLARDLRIDGATFRAGTPVSFRYGFPFFRAGWAYDVLAAADRELAFGAALQLRNATIEFESVDGRSFRHAQRRRPGARCCGPAGASPSPRGPSSPSRSTASTRPSPSSTAATTRSPGPSSTRACAWAGGCATHVDLFVNLRYIGGGATGQGDPRPRATATRATGSTSSRSRRRDDRLAPLSRVPWIGSNTVTALAA